MNEYDPHDLSENFHEEHAKLQKKPYVFNVRYLIVILIYAASYIGIVALIVTTIFRPMVQNNDNFIQTLNPTDLVANEVLHTPLRLGIVTQDVYERFNERYPTFIGSIYQVTEGNITWVLIYNMRASANGFAAIGPDSWVIEDENENLVLRSEIFEQIINGEITTWETSNFEIVLLITNPEYLSLPHFVTNPDVFEYLGAINVVRPTSLFVSFLNLIIFTALVIPMFFLLKPDLKDDFTTAKKDKQSIWLGGLIVFLIALGASVGTNIFIMMIPSETPVAANQLAIEIMMSSPGFFLLLLAVVFIGPVVEEFVFRRAIFGLIPNKWVGLVVSSLIFGLIHITSEIATGDPLLIFKTLLPYLAGGVAFGIGYIKYKENLPIVCLAHIFFNGFAVISMFLR